MDKQLADEIALAAYSLGSAPDLLQRALVLLDEALDAYHSCSSASDTPMWPRSRREELFCEIANFLEGLS